MIKKDTTIGRFRILESLGKGGMGNVYLAEDLLLERTVAIKALPARGLRDHFREKYLKEARTLSKLDHPNICRIYDFVQGAESDFLVLEYIQGRTLHAALKDNPSFEEKLQWAAQIAGVLKATHAKLITHRDLKPENIMITRTGQIKVLDFGLALSETPPVARRKDDADTTAESISTEELPQEDVFSDMETQGSISGSLRYMSPEQARAELITQKSDLFSLGVMLYEWFVGASPYDSQLSYPALLFHVGQGKMRPVETVASGLPPALVRLIRDLMHLDPDKRPDASAIQRRLHEILEAPLRRKRRRRRFIWAGSVAAAVVLAAFALWRVAFPAPLIDPGKTGRVGLLPIFNETGSADLEWVELGLMEMVGRTLEQCEHILLNSPDEVVQVIRAMGLDPDKPMTPEDLVDIQKTLGVDLLIATRLTETAGQYALHYEIRRKTGALSQRQIVGSDVFDMANTLAKRLALRLSPKEPSFDIRDVYSEDPFLNRVYAMGLQTRNVKGAKEATPFFEVCLVKDPDFQWARIDLALSQINAGDLDEGCVVLESLLERARQNAQTPMIIKILENLASVYTDQGKFADAEQYLNEALSLCSGPNLLNKKGGVHRILGKMCYLQGQYDEAEQHIEAALEIFRQVGDVYYETETLNLLGSVYLGRGDIERAESEYRKAAELAGTHHLPAAESRALGNLGNIALFSNRHQDAQNLLRQSLAYVEKTGDQRNTMVIKNSLAVAALNLKQIDRAEVLFREVLQSSEAMGLTELQASASLNLADIALRRRQPEKARPLIDAALKLNTWIKDSYYVDLYHAYYQYELGHFDQAYQLIQKARDAAPGGQWIEDNETLYQCIKNAAAQGHREPIPFEIR